MDGTELVTLAGSVGGAMASFMLGLRVCGPRLQTTWTERHPREIVPPLDHRDGQHQQAERGDDDRQMVQQQVHVRE